eukprot:TRINITY_DN14604_c0_g1_i1.p1 TRINITY_DN14604_c0_g1~~TRINITY_DN14604_c0_g1_i1.p1  ORF type:complete len:606 (-),score=110.01 TRINITY_DN14604_c0_g1_i1:463-2280(-)
MTMLACADGFVTKAHLQAVLQKFLRSNKVEGFDKDDLIQLMVKLELCYEEKMTGGSVELTRYFVPSTLNDANGKALIGERPLKWPLQQNHADSIHLGRRLQCKDQLTTFLGPGFFPRLQVRLRNKLFEKMGGKMNAQQYSNERNLITLYVDGLEVLLESPGDISDYIDILVRSEKSSEQTLTFLTVHIIEEIQSFCASSHGSPGVTLVEAIMRPECVSLLTLCTHRQNQVVLKEDLISCILAEEKTVVGENCGEMFSSEGSFDYRHTWIPAPGLGSAFESAKDLLGPGDVDTVSKKERIVQQQLSSIDEAARLVLGPALGSRDIAAIRGQSDKKLPIFAHTMSNIAAPSHRTVISSQILGQLNKIDNKLEVILSLQQQTLQKVDELRALQEHALETVLSKIDQIMNFSVQVVQSSLPRRPYFTTKDVGKVQKLVAGLRIGKAVMLHFMCEGTGENISHGVQGQVGYELIMEDAKWDGIRSIVANSVRLMIFLVKAGLHVAAGIGGAIPDYVSWGGATGVTAIALSGESLLNSLGKKLTGTSVEQSRCMEDEWWRLQEMLKKPLEGQMANIFGLYRARLTRDSERVAWVCEECLTKGKSKHILEPL